MKSPLWIAMVSIVTSIIFRTYISMSIYYRYRTSIPYGVSIVCYTLYASRVWSENRWIPEPNFWPSPTRSRWRRGRSASWARTCSASRAQDSSGVQDWAVNNGKTTVRWDCPSLHPMMVTCLWIRKRLCGDSLCIMCAAAERSRVHSWASSTE